MTVRKLFVSAVSLTALAGMALGGLLAPAPSHAAKAPCKTAKLIVPWKGIKFGPDGQNQLVRGILMQVQNGKYCTVYPFELASCELVYPMPTWAEKAKL